MKKILKSFGRKKDTSFSFSILKIGSVCALSFCNFIEADSSNDIPTTEEKRPDWIKNGSQIVGEWIQDNEHEVKLNGSGVEIIDGKTYQENIKKIQKENLVQQQKEEDQKVLDAASSEGAMSIVGWLATINHVKFTNRSLRKVYTLPESFVDYNSFDDWQFSGEIFFDRYADFELDEKSLKGIRSSGGSVYGSYLFGDDVNVGIAFQAIFPQFKWHERKYKAHIFNLGPYFYWNWYDAYFSGSVLASFLRYSFNQEKKTSSYGIFGNFGWGYSLELASIRNAFLDVKVDLDGGGIVGDIKDAENNKTRKEDRFIRGVGGLQFKKELISKVGGWSYVPVIFAGYAFFSQTKGEAKYPKSHELHLVAELFVVSRAGLSGFGRARYHYPLTKGYSNYLSATLGLEGSW